MKSAFDPGATAGESQPADKGEIPRISVLVATAARRERKDQLMRALCCIRNQVGVTPVPIIVANGPNQDPEIIQLLKDQPDLRLFSVETASYPFALQFARAQVETEWFSQMDDDDELMPHALETRYRVALEHGGCDAVISNGITRDASGDHLRVPNLDAVRKDPLRALIHANWLSPGGGLYRSAAVTTDLFTEIPKHLEWTYIAVRLALRSNLVFLDEPLYVYQENSPLALSRSDDYLFGLPAALQIILELPMPKDVKRAFGKKLAGARNANAMTWLRRGKRRTAWRWHFRTLFGVGGCEYISATRHFVGRVPS